MNERIKQLLKQAEHSVNEVFVWDPTGPDREDVIREKFAELIVKECGKVAWHYTPDTEELEYSHLIKDKILKRFGVEE